MYCARCGNPVSEAQKCSRCEPAVSLPGTPNPQGAIPDEKTFLVACHLAALASFVFPLGNILGPLLVWVMKKTESKAVDEHGKASLNFQLSAMLWVLVMWIVLGIIAGVLILFGMFDGGGLDRTDALVGAGAVILVSGIGLSVLLGIGMLVCVILASLAASRGELFKYPFSVKWIR